MKVVVEGCCHGELDKIYESIEHLEKKNGMKVDLLIICGDFQAVRNFDDLQAMAVPAKFQKLNSFYKYYSGEKKAPVLTIFIGGNHEASNFMQELPYGGWVAKNIYYMGYAGVIQVGGVRIGGISGIYKGNDFLRGHFERPPYDKNSIRSVYHVRNLEVFRLKQISRELDIFFSHDWPQGIYHHGDAAQLIKRKPFFKDEIERNCLGSRACADLLEHLKPTYWFAAHLHVKFAAHVEHEPMENGDVKTTKFLALDKCLPRRQFLQVLDIPHVEQEGLKIKLDPEWLTILQSTNHLLHLLPSTCHMPGPKGSERYDFRVADTELKDIEELFGNDLTLPENFEHTASPLQGGSFGKRRESAQPLSALINPQTTLLCSMLNIKDPNSEFTGKTPSELLEQSFPWIETKEDSDAEEEDDEGPSFIDSSLNQSTTFNSSSGFDSFSEAKSLNRSIVSALNSSAVKGNDDEDEAQSILSLQKKITSESFSSSSAAGSGGESDQVGTTLLKRESIADRLRALKGYDVEGSSFSSVEGSESTGSLNKSDTVACLEEALDGSDELKEILACQNFRQNSISEGSLPAAQVESDTPSKPVDRNMSDNKRRSGSEDDGTPKQGCQGSSKSLKKMKRRNVSVYEDQQE